MLIGNLNARFGSNRVANVVGTNGEATLSSKRGKTDRFLHIQ
jgi:hypothetical protein